MPRMPRILSAARLSPAIAASALKRRLLEAAARAHGRERRASHRGICSDRHGWGQGRGEDEAGRVADGARSPASAGPPRRTVAGRRPGCGPGRHQRRRRSSYVAGPEHRTDSQREVTQGSQCPGSEPSAAPEVGLDHPVHLPARAGRAFSAGLTGLTRQHRADQVDPLLPPLGHVEEQPGGRDRCKGHGFVPGHVEVRPAEQLPWRGGGLAPSAHQRWNQSKGVGNGLG